MILRTRIVALGSAISLLAAAEAAAATPAFDAPTAATLALQGPSASGTGTAVAQLGDVDGDGQRDAAVSAPFADLPGRPDAGIVRVVLGSRATRGLAYLHHESLPGFQIVGGRYFRAGFDVAAAGDLNRDGRDDVLLSASRHGIAGYKSPARAYVILGKPGDARVDLTQLTAADGFEIVGLAPHGFAGPQSLAGVGDVDRDGFDDIAVTEAIYDRAGQRYRGDVVVIFGRRRSSRLDLQRLGSRGFRLAGARRAAVAGAGYVNGDNRADLLIGAPSVQLPGRRYSVNSVFVVFGRRYRGRLDVRRLGTHGYRIGGLVPATIHRPAVAGVGDLNGDRRDDALLVRNPGGSMDRRPEAVVVFGSRSTRLVDAGRVATRGFRIRGEEANGRFSGLGAVAAVGDVNRDGIPDLGLGSYTRPADGSYDHSAFVVFGRRTTSTIALDDLGRGGFRLTGPPAMPLCGAHDVGAALAAGGDLDADDRPDLLVGAPALGDCAGQALLVPATPGAP